MARRAGTGQNEAYSHDHQPMINVEIRGVY